MLCHQNHPGGTSRETAERVARITARAQWSAYRTVENLVRHVSRNDDHVALLLLELPDDHAQLAQRLHVDVIKPLVTGQQEVHAAFGSLGVRVGELELQVDLHMVPVLGMYGGPHRRLALREQVGCAASVHVHTGVRVGRPAARTASGSTALALALALALLYEGHPQQ